MKRALMAFAVMSLALAATAGAQDVPMFRGDLRHTGVYAGAGITKLPEVKWKFQTGGGVVSSPAVVRDVVYIGSNDGNLYALEAGTGAVKWKFATESRIAPSPAVADGTVYFGSYDGVFYAVDEAGNLKWKFQTGGEKRFAGTHLHHLQPAAEAMPDPWDFYLSSPSVWNGTVYFGSGDSNIYALDARRGS